jgi:hypothetical protein
MRGSSLNENERRERDNSILNLRVSRLMIKFYVDRSDFQSKFLCHTGGNIYQSFIRLRDVVRFSASSEEMMIKRLFEIKKVLLI